MSVLYQIEELDSVLRSMKEAWMDAADEKKEKWMERINDLLDARMVLMRKRDEK